MQRRIALVAMVFVLPYLLFFLAFRILPAIGGVVLSLGDLNMAGQFSFVGTENFETLFADALFWSSLRATVVYSVMAVPAVIVVSLGMASLAARSVRGIGVYRAAFFLPVITSLVTTGVIWKWLYSTDGPFNWVLGLLGVGPVPFLSAGTAVLPALAAVAVWSRFGYDMLILLAGMLGIPRDYYEAAELDGAGAWQRFVHVTLPGLRRPLFFVVVLEVVASFQVFDLIYVMTGGGPINASYTLVYFIYDQGFSYGYFGLASAAGVVLLAITLTITLVQRRLMRGAD